jgi:hypothetical protein
MKGFELTAAADADVWDVARAIVNVVDMPFGTRRFRVHIDPAHDGAEIVNGVADHVRADMLRNMGLADLLKPSSTEIGLKKPPNPLCSGLVRTHPNEWNDLRGASGSRVDPEPAYGVAPESQPRS